MGRGREGEEGLGRRVEVEKVGRQREGEEGGGRRAEWKREGWEMRGEKGREEGGEWKEREDVVMGKWVDRQECLTQKGYQ